MICKITQKNPYKIHLETNLFIVAFVTFTLIFNNPIEKIRSMFTAFYWR